MKAGFRKVSFRYDLLDKNDIRIGTLDGVTSGKVSYGEFRAIKRSASFILDTYLQREINYLSDQIQPWFILHMPNGGTVEWPLGIFLLEAPDRNVTGDVIIREIGAYDKTVIIDEYRFTERHYIQKGTSYIGAIEKILTLTGITKTDIADSGLTLNSDKEFAIGTKAKEAVTELLNEMNYTSISVDANGYMVSKPYIEPSQRTITQVYSADRDSIILSGTPLVESLALAGRANVFTRVAVNLENDIELASTFVNDNPLSPVSTVSRGRRIVDFEQIDNIASQEVLDNYVRRIAIENSSAYSHFSFGTALMPSHGSADTLYLYIPSVFSSAVKFSETSWEMDLKPDGIMQHEARRIVQL